MHKTCSMFHATFIILSKRCSSTSTLKRTSIQCQTLKTMITAGISVDWCAYTPSIETHIVMCSDYFCTLLILPTTFTFNQCLSSKGRIFIFFGSRQRMFSKMNGRASAWKRNESARRWCAAKFRWRAVYIRYVNKQNANFHCWNATQV